MYAQEFRRTGLRLTRLLLVAALATAALAQTAAQRQVCGRLSRHEGQRVLEVWGTPADMGYAHGYLLAEEIVPLFDGYILHASVMPDKRVYEQRLTPATGLKFKWSQAADEELLAMHAGIIDRLGAERARSRILDRELTVTDLKLANALSDWMGMHCSSMTAWGELTVDGKPLTGRNLDFTATPVMAKAQLVIVRHGSGERRSWIGVGWPSLIGVYTAMNDQGVTMAIHDAPGLSATHHTGLTPRSLVLREALESAAGSDALADVERVLRKHHVMVGSNVHVSRAGDPSATVFEYDANDEGNGVTVRTHDKKLTALWTTNHMRERHQPSKCWRYAAIESELTKLTRGRKHLDASGALRIMRAAKTESTLHTVCFEPATRLMHARIGVIRDEVVTFDLGEWLKRREKDTAARGGNGDEP